MDRSVGPQFGLGFQDKTDRKLYDEVADKVLAALKAQAEEAEKKAAAKKAKAAEALNANADNAKAKA